MYRSSLLRPLSFLAFVLCGALVPSVHAGETLAPVQAEPKFELPDARVAAFRIELVDLAYSAASAFPANPHAKNRARAQQEVFAACLELELLDRARRFADGIDGWEKGASYGELAKRLAELGDTANAERCLSVARAEADEQRTLIAEHDGQPWRRDRILARIASAELALKRGGDTISASDELDPSSVSIVDRERAAHMTDEQFDAYVASVDEVEKIGDFDRLQAALWSCAELYDRFYADATRRETVHAKIVGSWRKMPIGIRVDLLLELGAAALRHDDAANARALATDAAATIATATWTPEQRIGVQSRLATLRHRAGEPAKAREDADFAFALYDSKQREIVDIQRGGALRPLAEAYLVLGDVARARKVYATALEAGVVNPNSRPRAQDLVATCCSMATQGFEPDAELWARVRAIRAGLGAPW